MPVAMQPTAAAPMATIDSLKVDLQNKVQEAKRLEELMKQTKEDSIIKNDAENALESLRRENHRLEGALATTRTGIAEVHTRLEEEQAQQTHEKARMEKQLAEVQRSRAANAGSSAQGVQQNQQLKTALAQRKQRDIEIKRRLTETAAAMQVITFHLCTHLKCRRVAARGLPRSCRAPSSFPEVIWKKMS